MPIATIGRTVHVLGSVAHAALPAAAIITRAWSERDTSEGAVAVNVTVFGDGAPPEYMSSVMLFETEHHARAYRAVTPHAIGPVAYWPPRLA